MAMETASFPGEALMKPIVTALAVLFLAACSRPIPSNVHDQLDRYFASRPMENGWKYVKATHGFGGQELVADILVPAPLPGDPGTLRETVKSKLCPPRENNEFWRNLKGYKLSVAIYTSDRKFTLLADCNNPYERDVPVPKVK
jgi:hypothetical protein